MITGTGKWVEILANADQLFQHLIVTAERKFWRRVESGKPPRPSGVEPPKPQPMPSASIAIKRSRHRQFNGRNARLGAKKARE
jgi:hypothetical protein